MPELENLNNYNFEPYQLNHNSDQIIFVFSNFLILTCQKTLKIAAESEIDRLGLDVTCWKRIEKSLRTLNCICDVTNKNGIIMSLPLFHIIHSGENLQNYTEYLTEACNLFKNLTGKMLEFSIVVSDGEKALYGAAKTVFGPRFLLRCAFHQSANIREQFCKEYKLDLDDKESQIFFLFHQLKWLILVPLEISIKVLEIIIERVKKIKFKSHNKSKKGVRVIRQDMLSIILYMRKKIVAENKFTTHWLTVALENQTTFCDRTNNKVEASNKVLGVKIKNCGGSNISKLMRHKIASASIHSKFRSDFIQRKTYRKKKAVALYNQDTLLEIANAIKNSKSEEEIFNIISRGLI